jgi:nitrate reductase gamma subunit
MMAMRRWLTARYDWSGLSKRLYLSEKFEFGILGVVALIVLGLFFVPGWLGAAFGFPALNPEALQHVRLDIFAPKQLVHYGDWVLAALLLVLLASNGARMLHFLARGNPRRAPLSLWLSKLPELLIHGATQKRWRECDRDTRWRWLQHFLLVTGYATMFLLVVVFLKWFQRDGTDFHWTALFGYYGTVMLLGATVLAMRGRLRKDEPLHKFSHASDWMFLVLLFLTALSGIVLHVFRLLDMPWPTYVFYVAHLMIAVPMLVVEVPFGKWLHLVLRPVAAWVVAVREAELAMPAPAAATVRPLAA